MTPETTQTWKDTLSRLRHERDAYAERAAQRRKDATECRRRRDFLAAIKADDRAAEYRRVRDQLAAEINQIRATYGLR